MADNIDLAGSGSGGDIPDPQKLAAWINGAQQRVASGGQLDNSGMWDPQNGKFGTPAGYAVHDGQLVQDAMANWNPWVDVAGIAGFGTLGALAGPVASGAGGASEAAGGSAYLNPSEFSLTSTPGLGGNSLPTLFGSGAGAGGSLPAVGSLPNWLKTAQDVGSALGATSAGRAQGRVAEGTANQNQANAAANLYRSQLNAPSIRAGQAVHGDILANARDSSFSGVPSDIPVPQISGGLRPSLFSPATRELGKTLSTGALAAQQRDGFPVAPTLPPLPQAGGLDSSLNAASVITGVLGATQPLWKQWLR